MAANKVSPTKKRLRSDESGMAIIETLPLLVIFLMFIGFSIGFFGAIHTGILYSIAARTYAFETFRHRTDLTYFREQGSGIPTPQQYETYEVRYHAITNPSADPSSGSQEFLATTRPISRTISTIETQNIDHQEKVYQLEQRNRSVSVNPIWVTVGYGMCLKASCGL